MGKNHEKAKDIVSYSMKEFWTLGTFLTKTIKTLKE